MNFINVLIEEINPNYILGKTVNNVGYRFFTLTEDVFLINNEYRLFVYEDVKLENNTILINRFGFLNRRVRDLFQFLISLKGIGCKGAVKIILFCGGSKNLVEILKNNDKRSISRLPKKYSQVLAEAVEKKKNQEIIGVFSSEIEHKSIRSEVLWILYEMDQDRTRSIAVLDLLDKRFKESGLKNGIEDLKVEEVLREAMAILFQDR